MHSQLICIELVLQSYADALLYQNDGHMLSETKQELEMRSREAGQASPAGNSSAAVEGLPSQSAAPAGTSTGTPAATTTQQQLDANRSGSATHKWCLAGQCKLLKPVMQLIS